MVSSERVKRIRVMFNPKSGQGISAEEIRRALQPLWDVEGMDLTYQVSRSVKDGSEKARRAVEDGVDVVLAVGGDGVVNSIGKELVGTDTALGVLPTGSGNGFARHFDIPLSLEKAARELKEGEQISIDVGMVEEHPFFVTCALAWDADLVKGFEESPVRGVLPYVFAGIYHWFTYEPQSFRLELDGEVITLDKPVVLTVANLTQYGGGAKINPDADPADEKLELISVPRLEPVKIVAEARRLFDGSIKNMPDVTTRQFRTMKVRRERPGAVAVDGELLELGRELTVSVRPRALNVVVPKGHAASPKG